MAEGNHAYAFGLCHTAKIGDRDAGYAVDRLHAIELECINDEVKPISLFALDFGRL